MIENDKQLTIKIETTQGTWEANFEKTQKVQEVILSVIQHFDFSQNGNYELRLEKDPDNALALERTLISYKIKSGDILVFTDLGVAV